MTVLTNPGVYVNEAPLSFTARRGNTSRSVACFFGEAPRGPSTATLINSWTAYKSQFGELRQNYDLGYAVYHFFANGGREAFINRIVADDAASASVAVAYYPNGTESASATLLTATGVSEGVWGNGLTLEVTPGLVTATTTRMPTFNLIIKLDGSEVERWNELSVDPANNRYALVVLNTYSKFITATVPSATPSSTWTFYTLPSPGTGGSDGAVVADQEYIDALSNLDLIEGVLLMNAVGRSNAAVVNAYLDKAEERGNSFVVIDPDATETNVPLIGDLARTYTTSSYGAVYYPMLRMIDPSKSGPSAIRTTYPGGAIMGAYIRTEYARTVAKAPAGYNVELRNSIGLGLRLSESQTGDLYNNYNVNTLKAVAGGGIVINGARTLVKTNPGKYIPIRRSLNFLKQALKDVTAFAVFEPNDERLWNRLNMTISSLLSEFWRAGGLRGSNAEEAFYIICDETNNFINTLENGEVHVEVGVSLQYPAEYVVINLSQWTGGSNLSERYLV
jgi:hypothetical protein